MTAFGGILVFRARPGDRLLSALLRRAAGCARNL